MDEIELINRNGIHFATVKQLYPVGAGQRRVNAALEVVPADLFPVQGHRLVLVEVPDHEPAQSLDVLRFQPLNSPRV